MPHDAPGRAPPQPISPEKYQTILSSCLARIGPRSRTWASPTRRCRQVVGRRQDAVGGVVAVSLALNRQEQEIREPHTHSLASILDEEPNPVRISIRRHTPKRRSPDLGPFVRYHQRRSIGTPTPWLTNHSSTKPPNRALLIPHF